MNKPLSTNDLRDVESYTLFFRNYKWQATMTTRIPSDMEVSSAHEQLVTQVLAPLAAHIGTKIGAISVTVPAITIDGEYTEPHIHSLLLSYEGNLFESQEEMQLFLLDNLKPGTLLHNAAACNVKGIAAASRSDIYYLNATRYMAKNLVAADGAKLDHYKKRLLLRRMKPCQG